jgi:transcriptional regulator with XRE-family HTH domain
MLAIAMGKTEPTIDTATTVGQRIRAAYLAKGLNRSKLQRAIGAAYTTILAWERDEAVPGTEYLNALSVVLGVSPSWILGEESPVTEPQYKAWALFLASVEGGGMNASERRTLGSLRFDDTIEPTPELYRALLLGLRMGMQR